MKPNPQERPKAIDALMDAKELYKQFLTSSE